MLPSSETEQICRKRFTRWVMGSRLVVASISLHGARSTCSGVEPQVSKAGEVAKQMLILKRFPDRIPEFDLPLHTGMRHGEQYGARWQDVDFEHCILTVPRDKRGRTSHVRLNDAALSALLRLRERTLLSGRDGLVRGLSVNDRDHRILVALSPPHLCQSSRDRWCRPTNRGRIAQGQDATYGHEVFASCT
jgi:integrase